MRTDTTNPNRLEALQQEPRLDEHPELVLARENLTRAHAQIPAAAAELARAEEQMARAEAAAAEAAADDPDLRPLTAARKRVMDAESTQRIRQASLRHAAQRVTDTQERVTAAIVAQCRAAFDDLLPALDAKLAEAAVIDRELAMIAERGRVLLSGSPRLNDLCYWTPLVGLDGRCHYAHWRIMMAERGFRLPPVSPAHTLPAPPTPAATVSLAGFSNRPEPEVHIAIGPGGQPKPEKHEPMHVRVFGTAVAALVGLIGGMLR